MSGYRSTAIYSTQPVQLCPRCAMRDRDASHHRSLLSATSSVLPGCFSQMARAVFFAALFALLALANGQACITCSVSLLRLRLSLRLVTATCAANVAAPVSLSRAHCIELGSVTQQLSQLQRPHTSGARQQYTDLTVFCFDSAPPQSCNGNNFCLSQCKRECPPTINVETCKNYGECVALRAPAISGTPVLWPGG